MIHGSDKGTAYDSEAVARREELHKAGCKWSASGETTSFHGQLSQSGIQRHPDVSRNEEISARYVVGRRIFVDRNRFGVADESQCAAIGNLLEGAFYRLVGYILINITSIWSRL